MRPLPLPIERFCFTGSYSFPPILLLPSINDVDLYFIYLVNITSHLTGRLPWALGHWDFMKKQDFKQRDLPMLYSVSEDSQYVVA